MPAEWVRYERVEEAIWTHIYRSFIDRLIYNLLVINNVWWIDMVSILGSKARRVFLCTIKLPSFDFLKLNRWSSFISKLSIGSILRPIVHRYIGIECIKVKPGTQLYWSGVIEIEILTSTCIEGTRLPCEGIACICCSFWSLFFLDSSCMYTHSGMRSWCNAW